MADQLQLKTPAAARLAVSRSWARELGAVFRKDVSSELRSRSALYSVLLFALVSLALISFLPVTEGIGLTLFANFALGRAVPGDTYARSLLLASLLWIVFFFSAISGMARTFVKEEERRTVLALQLAARPLAVYFGKLLFNVVLLEAVAAVVLPLFVILFHPKVTSGGMLVAEVALGCAALAASATILGAIVARSGSGSALFAALAFPVILFVLVLAINGTAGALAGGQEMAKVRNQIPALVSYLVAMVTVSAMLFEQVWQA